MSDKTKLSKLKPFDHSKYKNVDLDHLVMYAISQLENIGADLSFENTVVAAFILFPSKFSLLGFPSYPDSMRVYTCTRRSITDRKKRWLGGRQSQGFIINDRSRVIIKEAESLLLGASKKKLKATSQTRRKELLISEVESSSAYSKYNKGEGLSISEAELCSLLQCTLDSSKETLRDNLNSLNIFADELGRTDISAFLNWLKSHFTFFIDPPRR